MKKRRWLRWLWLPLLLGAVVMEARHYLGRASLTQSDDQLRVEELQGSLEPVRSAFNQAADRWRLLVLTSPMSPASLAGLDALWRSALTEDRDLPIQTLVVHAPALPWDRRDKARARHAWPSETVRFFWDGQAELRGRLTTAAFVPGRQAPGYAANASFLVYAPGVEWSSEDPPEPTYLLSGGPPRLQGDDGALGPELLSLMSRARGF